MKTSLTFTTAAPPFPLKIIRAAIAAMVIALGVATYFTSRIGSELQAAMRSQIDVLTETQRLKHYGDVLELSIRTVANYGDKAAAKRFKAVLPQHRDTIVKLRRHLRIKEDQAIAAQLGRTDLALVAMENEAIALAHLGQLQEARSIIQSHRYERLLKTYYGSIRSIEARANAFIAKAEGRLRWHLYGNLALTIASFGLVILGWLAIVRPARHWGAQLDDARASAEAATRQLAANQVELLTLNSKLFEQARHDPLTKLQSRLKLNEDLEQLWPRVDRYGERYCAIICDLDYFKNYNDTHGHLAGDQVLRQVADALSSVCRRGDQLYRFGGEEFVIIVSDCSIQGGIISADRYRAAVERANIPHSASPFGIVTASLGVASLEPGKDATIESWLHEADVALYEAKEVGRNRVVGRQSATTRHL